MSNATPAGLRRYARSMRTRYSGKCHFCGDATVPGNDFAAQTGSNWIAVCIPCADSLVAQVRGVYRRLQVLATAPETTQDMLAAASVQMPSSENLGAAMQDGALDTIAFDVLIALLSAVPCFTPADPIKDQLQAVADNTKATPKDRTVAASMVENIAKWGKLTEKQASYAQAIIGKYSSTGTPAPAADRTPLELGLYLVGNDVWWVREGRKTGNTYAMLLMSARDYAGKADWQYVKGGMNIARKGVKDDGTIAAQLGHAAHACCFCGIALTDDGDGRSVKVGYGPVCAAKYGLPWG